MRQRQIPAVSPELQKDIEQVIDSFFETHCHSQKGYIAKICLMSTEDFVHEAIKNALALVIGISNSCKDFEANKDEIAQIVSNKTNEHMKQLFVEGMDYGLQKLPVA